MFTQRGIFMISASITILLLGLLAIRSANAEETIHELPRYRLEVGQQLNYKGSNLFEYEGGAFDTRDQWKIFVVSKNGDSWRLVIRYSNVMAQKRAGAVGNERESVYWASADLDSKGNIVERLGSFGYRVNPSKIFPKLAADSAELAKGWQGDAQFGGVVRYRMMPSDSPDTLKIETVEDRVENTIYGLESSAVYNFDLKRGLADAIASHSKQTYGFNGEGKGETKLTDIELHDVEWCAKFAAAAERFLAAQQAFRVATEADDATTTSLDEAVNNLREYRDKMEDPELEKQVDYLLDNFQGMRKYTEESIRDRKALLGQQATEFKTTDLDDQPKALSDYRGKVVLLDFWYRGCGWCIRCMPQLKEVADHYRDKPVVILGMNTDDNVEDAKFVIDKMGLNYTTLKAPDELPKKFHVHGFPTLILIDQEGKIRDNHAGWSPTLREDLIKKIDAILAETK